MLNKLNKIEMFFQKNLKSKTFLRTDFFAKIFSILNKGNNYWHLLAKSQDIELLNIVKDLNKKYEINSYNKEGILPIHQYLSAIVKFGDEENEFHPYFDFNEEFFNLFLEQNPDLNKFWLKPIYSSWLKLKEEKSKKVNHIIETTFKFNFPSLKIVGYPSEMLFLIFRDIFLYHEVPENVFNKNYPIYEKIFLRLFNFDEKDIRAKIESQKNPEFNKVKYFPSSHISDFMIVYIASIRDFYCILPLLKSQFLDFNRQNNNDGLTVLHNLFGKINTFYDRLPESLLDKVLSNLAENPNFSLKHLEIPNHLGSSPISILRKSSQPVVAYFKTIKLHQEISKNMDKVLEENKETSSLDEEEESPEDEISWRI